MMTMMMMITTNFTRRRPRHEMGQRFLPAALLVAKRIAPGRCGRRHNQRSGGQWWCSFSSSSSRWDLYHRDHEHHHLPPSSPQRHYYSSLARDAEASLSISKKNDATTADTASEPSTFFKSGPSLQLGMGRLARLAESSVVAHCGKTLVLTTVCRRSGDSSIPSSSSSNFLTVDYRQKAAATGRIPTHNRQRQDARLPSRMEILAARAVDRALRPLLLQDNNNNNPAAQQQQQQQQQYYHVHAVVQAVGSGHAVATALNAAAAALRPQLQQAVAATCIGVTRQGTYVQDPVLDDNNNNGSSRSKNSNDEDKDDIVGELLLAGTKDGKVVMLEWTSRLGCSLPETQFAKLLQVGLASLQPIFDTLDELHELQQQQQLKQVTVSAPGGDDADETTRIRASLGLPPLPRSAVVAASTAVESSTTTDDQNKAGQDQQVLSSTSTNRMNRHELLRGAISYCQARLGDATERLFGRTQSEKNANQGIGTKKKRTKKNVVRVHPNDDSLPLLSKSVRGRREQIVLEEITRLVDAYLLSLSPDDLIDSSTTTTTMTTELSPSPTAILSNSDRTWLQYTTANRLLRQALWSTSSQWGTRADGRHGPTVRPLQMAVPALPPTVHGSALFARGDTQVVCTVTLGAPCDGQPDDDEMMMMRPPTTVPKNKTKDSSDEDDDESEDGASTTSPDKLPVGSLRFLRTQQALESDLNSRRSKADKERTGDSGRLADVRRAFLQYDFPAYATGEVPLQRGIDRRAVGHGALAERALAPVLPDADVFPYSIRMTSEVTDSNGSSSMASVCGVTLALLDAGVPLRAPVAGVSVGLAIPAVEDNDNDDSDNEQQENQQQQERQDQYSLLLDITGTEDHYGAMDFKIAGTRNGVTAAQLDVKQPLPVQVLVQALDLAKEGRAAILQSMSEQMANSPIANLRCRPEPKATAPRVEVVRFDPNRKRDLVGPGGVVLRQLEERYGVELDLTQEGQCLLFGTDREMVRKAKMTVMELVADVVVGEVYTGTVIETKDFGAVLELLRNKEGLLHVTEMVMTSSSDPRTHPEGAGGFVRQQLKVGQKIDVLCIGVDPLQGSVKLSQKALVQKRQTESKVDVI